MERAGGVRGPTARGSQVLHLSPPRLLSVISARLSIQLLPRLRDSCRPADRVADCPPNGAAVSLAPAQSFPGRTRPLSPFRYGCLPACGRICCHIDRGDPLRAQGNPLCPREYTRYPQASALVARADALLPSCGCSYRHLWVSQPLPHECAAMPRRAGLSLCRQSEQPAGREKRVAPAPRGGRGAGAWVGAAGGAAALGSPDGGIRRGLSARPRGGRALR